MRAPKSTEKSMGRGAREAAAQSRGGRASEASVRRRGLTRTDDPRCGGQPAAMPAQASGKAPRRRRYGRERPLTPGGTFPRAHPRHSHLLRSQSEGQRPGAAGTGAGGRDDGRKVNPW